MSLVSLSGYSHGPTLGAQLATVPHALLRAHLGKPPGLMVDVGGVLSELADPLQRDGWILHTACEDPQRIKSAARAGVRTVLRAPAHRLPFQDSQYNAGVLALSESGDLREALAELQRVCRPGARVVISTSLRGDLSQLRSILGDCGMTDVVTYVDDGSAVVLHIGQDGPLLVTARTSQQGR